jgi:REP element-mobilizing transposase RayT
MPSSYSMLLYHCVFGTKDRQGLITKQLARRLHPYINAIVHKTGGRVHAIGGTKDHVHMLMELPTDASVAEAMRLVKGNSSRWVNAERLCDGRFQWQAGFAAFSVSASAAESVRDYVARQEEHHRRGGFAEELASLLRRHGIDFDPRSI